MSRSDDTPPPSHYEPPDLICTCQGTVEVDWETHECKECGCRVSMTPSDNSEPDPEKLERGLRLFIGAIAVICAVILFYFITCTLFDDCLRGLL